MFARRWALWLSWIFFTAGPYLKHCVGVGVGTFLVVLDSMEERRYDLH